MITGQIIPEWSNHRYAGGGTYYINNNYLCATYRVYGELQNVTFNGVYTILEYSRDDVNDEWTITEHTEQVYVSYYLETFDYTRRFDGSVADGLSVNTKRYDVQRIIVNINYINTSLFPIHPPDWSPDPTDTGNFWKLGQFGVFDYSALQWYLDENNEPTMEEIPDSAEYTTPIPLYQWTIKEGYNDGFPFNELMPDDAEYTLPMPKSQWRIQEGYNDGFPWNELLPDIPYQEPPVPVKQRPYICLYRFDTPQNGFDNHGMFVLTPTKCTITEELNGKYEFSMEHPIDPEGRWQYIRENAIVKAMGQLFTIRVVNQQWKGSSGKIVAKGDHIWYQLGDRWLAKTSGETEGISSIWVSTLVSKAHEKLVGAYFESDTHYSFTPYIQNGLYVPQGIGEGRWEFLTEGITPVEFFLGSQGVVAACEGEFHRDNFNFYINKRKHGSSDNAFDIRIGKNLTAIKRTIDTSSLVTYVKGYTNYDKEGTQPYGGTFAVSWTDSLLADYGIPHHIYREKEFSYNFPINWVYGDGETKVEKLLAADVEEWFRQNNQPLIAYEIDMRDVKNNPEYQELVNVDSYKVGDMGYIHDPHIGDIQIEITKSVTNAITGEVEQVVFGNVRDFVGQPPSQLVIDPETVVVEVYFQVMDSSGAFCFDRNGDMIVEYEGV